MNAATNNLFAGRFLGNISSEDYVHWAIDCLENGLDSKNIRILASLGKPLYSYEAEDYFKRSLRDLGWNQPDPAECLTEYVGALAEQIVKGTVTPAEGCANIYRVCVELKYPRALMVWVYLDEGLDPENYGDLSGAALDSSIIREARRFMEVRRFEMDNSRTVY